MFLFTRLAGPVALGALLATAAFAESHIDPAIAKAMKARASHMTLNAFNIGTVGGMAQDKIPYDAAAATRAANNMAALASIDQTGYWIEGSDSESVEDSDAKPEIWADMAGFEEDQQALADATVALAAVAGTDLDSLKAAFGAVGEACGACHKAYRVADE